MSIRQSLLGGRVHESLLPILSFSSHKLRKIRSIILPYAGRIESIEERALEYLPYYHDELSREILHDRIDYLKTRDQNIFMDRAEKTGMKFHRLPPVIGDGASGIVLLHDSNSRKLRYTRRALEALEQPGNFRMMTLKEFLLGAEILPSEIAVSALSNFGNELVKAGLFFRRTKPRVFRSTFFLTRDDLQYFDVFSPVENEVVVDAGAYDGGTALQFLEWGGDKVKHVYSFEFDPVNAEKCRENLRPYSDKVTVISKGTWDKDETMRVKAAGGTGSSVNSEGDTEVHLASIDSVVKDEPVTFIKMDVEGAELKSLMGAKNTIVNNRPRLAICVYHKPEDLYEIPGYILSLVPEYKFCLRHYSSRDWETVLYASCE